MKTYVTLTAILLLFIAAAAMQSRADQPNKVSAFMTAKLNHSKNLIEGLATEDYKLLAKNAQDLALLSQATTWKVLQTEDYLRHSNEFRRSADAIRKAAEDKNLDGATLAYVQMTMNCVTCHKYVRQVQQ
ncbi:MAG: hypothetical protein MI757_11680 [Pirellulales bacterium]|nr:hypothetical protein [Pirellulales bacterium]